MCLYEWTPQKGSFQYELFERQVGTAAYSSDGGMLAVGTNDGSVGVWDIRSDARVLWRYKAHDAAVLDVVFSLDDRWLASAGGDLKVHLWDPLRTEQHRIIEGPQVATNKMAFSSNGRLAFGKEDGTVDLWRRSDFTLEKSFGVRSAPVTALAFSPSADKLVSGSKDNIIRVWDLAGGPERRFPGHVDAVRALAFSPDGSLLVSGGDDGTIRIWLMQTAEQVWIMSEHAGGVIDLAWDATGTLLVSAESDGTVRLWGVPTK